MSAEVRVGGSSKKLTGLRCCVGGSDKAVKAGYVMVGGASKQFYTAEQQIITNEIITTDISDIPYDAKEKYGAGYTADASGFTTASWDLSLLAQVTGQGIHNLTVAGYIYYYLKGQTYEIAKIEMSPNFTESWRIQGTFNISNLDGSGSFQAKAWIRMANSYGATKGYAQLTVHSLKLV